MLAEAACIFRCASRQAAADAAVAWRRRWKNRNPWAVQQFADGLEDSLMFYNLPAEWWRRVRTNNPLERLIRTPRMRLNPINCFHDDPAADASEPHQLLPRRPGRRASRLWPTRPLAQNQTYTQYLTLSTLARILPRASKAKPTPAAT
jgi:hypothetical protein